jgi:energy-coupling factor transporter ATP-binding protein EcfA2
MSRQLLTLLLSIIATLSVIGSALAQNADLKALDGEWVYVEDRTEGRALEQLGPPMNSTFILKVEEGAVILVWGHGGGGNRNVRVALNGSITEVAGATAGALTRYRASWKDGVLTYEIDFVRAAGQAPEGLIKREFRMSQDGLIVRSNLELTPGVWSVGLFRHPQDIAMPTPAKAVIGDLSWITGAWIGSRPSGSTFEERWSPAKGGAMLATSRTVNASGKMSAFEFLRIVERDGGLVYIAQPNGAPPTEFVLTELSAKRAVFDNPRHDYPKRIVYELSADGGLTAMIGFMKGGTPRRFEFKREGI